MMTCSMDPTASPSRSGTGGFCTVVENHPQFSSCMHVTHTHITNVFPSLLESEASHREKLPRGPVLLTLFSF